MYSATKFWYGWIDDGIDCSDALVLPDAAVSGTPIVSSRDVEAKPSVDYG